MKVTYAPIVSDASGRMGGIVATRWRGINIFRRFVAPAQPRTAAQVEVRNKFRLANALYGFAPTYALESWSQYQASRPAIARNGFIAAMGDIASGESDLSTLIAYFNRSGVPFLEALTATPTAGTITFTSPTQIVPSGWTVDNITGFAIRSVDPSDPPVISDLHWEESNAQSENNGNEVPPAITGLAAADYLSGAVLRGFRTGSPDERFVGRGIYTQITVPSS